MSVVGALQLLVLAGLLLAVLAGWAVSAVIPWLLRQVHAWAPRSQHRALVLVAIAPALLGLGAVVAVIVPSLVPLVWPGHDHCLAHDDGHLHMCAVHLPHGLGNAASWVLLAVGLGWCATAMVRMLGELRRASRISAGLLAHGREDPSVGAMILSTDTPLCVLVGVLRPVVVLSEGLRRRLSPSHLHVVLHHERAHARRRDTLVRLVARVGTGFMLRSPRARLLEALELAAEQCCDEHAAASLGRVRVVEAILKVERMLCVTPASLRPVSVSFGGHAVEQRVTALLDEPRHAGHTTAVAVGLAVAVVLVLAASEPLHHLIESLLTTLAH
jgi:hypothetical protein